MQVEMVETRTAIPGGRLFHPVYSAARRGGNKRVEYVNIKKQMHVHMYPDEHGHIDVQASQRRCIKTSSTQKQQGTNSAQKHAKKNLCSPTPQKSN